MCVLVKRKVSLKSLSKIKALQECAICQTPQKWPLPRGVRSPVKNNVSYRNIFFEDRKKEHNHMISK